MPKPHRIVDQLSLNVDLNGFDYDESQLMLTLLLLFNQPLGGLTFHQFRETNPGLHAAAVSAFEKLSEVVKRTPSLGTNLTEIQRARLCACARAYALAPDRHESEELSRQALMSLCDEYGVSDDQRRDLVASMRQGGNS